MSSRLDGEERPHGQCLSGENETGVRKVLVVAQSNWIEAGEASHDFNEGERTGFGLVQDRLGDVACGVVSG